MSRWVIKGISTGIKTTAYPRVRETAAGVTPGLPRPGKLDETTAKALAERCPRGVFKFSSGELTADIGRCVHCYRCVRDIERPIDWDPGFEWARESGKKDGFPKAFSKSLNVCVLDTGDCGACLNEVRQLNNPYYNMHRLGFFITPTPRHADILLIVGPVTDHMKFTLEKVYAAMPAPKRVVAVGSCALSGGIFSESFVCSEGVSGVLPVDVEVPGNPPPPLAILHGLLVAAGRKSGSKNESPKT